MREEITPSREGESIAGCASNGRKEADEVLGVQFDVGVAGGKAAPKNAFHLIDPKRGFVAIAEGAGLVTPDPVVPRTTCAVAHTSFKCRFGEGRALVSAFEDASAHVLKLSRTLGRRCGASLLLLEVKHDRARVAWLGDTVCYRIRGDSCDLRTIPDRLGACGPLEYVGRRKSARHLTRFDVRQDDRLLVCTGAVGSTLTSNEIMQLVSRGGDARRLAVTIARAVTAKCDRPARVVVLNVGT